MEDFKMENDILHRSKFKVELYGCCDFSEIRRPNLFRKLDAIGPTPPVVAKTRGEKDPCSISRTRWSYFLFLSFLIAGR